MEKELDDKALEGVVGGLPYETARDKFISTLGEAQRKEKQKIEKKDPDEVSEEELDKMSYDYNHGNEDAYIRR